MQPKSIVVIFILSAALAIGVRCQKEKIQSTEDIAIPPNVIVLLADDLGYGDLSIYGSQSIETPNIDSLARLGMRFSSFYAGSAVCSPSRACLLTGKFPLRFDIRRHFTDEEEHLPTSATTISEILGRAGYFTAHIGKWHLGGLRPKDYKARNLGQKANPGPLQHGFDHSLTSIEGAPIRPDLINKRQLYRQGGKYMVRNDQRAKENSGHWTEIKVDEAIEVIDMSTKAQKPFFLNLWFDVPHTPYEPAPEPHYSKYKRLGVQGDQLKFRSMVSHLDANIGRLIRHLKGKGIFENTLILFTSDNGPAYEGSPGPFRGGKTDLHEGGIRVPMFAVWKNKIPQNSHSFNTIHMADLLPTVCDAVNIKIEDSLNLDGKSQWNVFTDNEGYTLREPLFWQMDLYKHFQNQGPKPKPFSTSVVIEGKWKMLADSINPVELFNLQQDHRELYNLLGSEPEIERSLSGKLEDFLQAERNRSGFLESN
ncbi:sulfatase-like hydrolase/transferase [Flavobacteriaceae bacterium TP-CH-4]|uniref:Sulfatase-like hydrolase/transferase n=1 Tax=Pelagihabitans pacificus TaxID=2696054 RepID=A0A967E9J5_9FLAO|nr:sulfatase-like hydrolase/transferase [Pelagihabitans pacificus]NHF58531.1 sulfatase-like hydrolase/transferase [Pelagihabitans pacificus]